jgi:putative membrane protein
MTADRTRRSGPELFELDELQPAPHTPYEAPPPPEPEAPLSDPAAARAVRAAAAHKRRSLAWWFWGALAGLIGLALSVATYDFILGLMQRYPALGALGLGLTAIVVLALAAFAAREAAALARLGRVEDARAAADKAAAAGDRAEALRAVRALERLYRRRRELDWGLAELRAREGDLLDAEAMLDQAERALMRPLDRRAEKAVGRAARSVAGATALVPLALVDVLAAFTLNLRMIREVAEIYGGRSGWVGSWRLLKAVASHLVATGAIAVTDDFIHAAFGGGLLAKLSRRFGEGLVNGVLTARVGAAAIEVCRPLPFRAVEKPTARGLAAAALRDMAGV